ncbi:MAG TPA: BBE domain-containing protein, partial [Actinomycetes bacterium]|nr:BBE domain-containing protein [Actinomycetes bacterium]
NFSGDGDIGDDLRASAFGDNLLRLSEVKERFDPTNLFSLNNNVRPAGSVGLPGQRITVDEGAKAKR